MQERVGRLGPIDNRAAVALDTYLDNNVASFAVPAPRERSSIRIGGPLEMNSPTPFSSSSDDRTDFSAFHDSDPQPKREGLPAGFRMRATAHYVDQLESPPRPTLRAVPTAAIEGDSGVEAPEPLVRSIRLHGVIEPLLVRIDPRGRHYYLMAGRRRLAAARALGLAEVPCVVHTIGEREAAALRDAMRDATSEATGHDPVSPPPHDASNLMYAAQREVESALTTIESCTPLLTLTSETARRGAAQVIAGESRRAQRVLTAMKVLGESVPLRRVSVRAVDLFARVRDSFCDEQRLLGADATVHIVADSHLTLYGDDHLLVTAMSGALAALTVAAGDRPRDIVLNTVHRERAMATLELIDRSLVLSAPFIRNAFVSTWPVPNGDAVLMQLQAARRIATAHGGTLAIASDAARTTIAFELPADPPVRSSAN